MVERDVLHQAEGARTVVCGRRGDRAERIAAELPIAPAESSHRSRIFLCGAPASYVTGTALRCDGGLVRGL